MKPLTLEETGTKTDDNEMCIKGIDELPIFSWNTKTKEFYVLGHKFDGINSIEDFINYIHNLDKENKFLQSQLKAKEEENKQLKEQVQDLKADYGTIAQIERDLYKDVIEEVREYIEDWLFDVGGNGASMSYEDINELLQILDKGIKDEK